MTISECLNPMCGKLLIPLVAEVLHRDENNNPLIVRHQLACQGCGALYDITVSQTSAPRYAPKKDNVAHNEAKKKDEVIPQT